MINLSSRNVHLIITRTLFTPGQLHSGKPPTRNYSIYFAMFILVIPVKSYIHTVRVTYVIVLAVQCCKVKTYLVNKSMLKVNLKTCPQVVIWTKGNSSLLHIALMTIQEMPSWSHPGLDYNNSKSISSLLLRNVHNIIILVELHFITQSVSI